MKSIRFRFVLLFLSTSAAFAQNTVTLLLIADACVCSGSEKENVRLGPAALLNIKLSCSSADGFPRESYLNEFVRERREPDRTTDRRWLGKNRPGGPRRRE